MKQMLSLIVVILLLAGGIGVHGEVDVPGCDAAGAVYFEEYLYPVFADYTALRQAFVAEGNIGQVGGELIALRARLDSVLEDSPACLDGFALDLALSMANMQTGILFLILSFEMDDPALAERFQQMGLYYGGQSDGQYVLAVEAIASFTAKRLVIEGEPGADNV
jgi:hypothetical protein